MMLGLVGVIISVFVGVYVSFWTSDFRARQVLEDPAISLFLVIYAVASIALLVASVALGVVVLIPKTFAMGVELTAAYAKAQQHSVSEMKEAALRTLTRNLGGNMKTYLANVLPLNIAWVLTLLALAFGATFVVHLVVSVEIVEFGPRTSLRVLMAALSLLALGAGLSEIWRMTQHHRALVLEETERLKQYKDLIQGLE